MKRRHTLLLLLSTMVLISCKTQKICTSDSTVESTHSETVITDSVTTAHVEQTITTDSVVIEKTIEKETVITVDLDGKEISRETNCNTTTNRDHFRDRTNKTDDKQEVRHNENLKKDSTLVKNHSEVKVITEEPNFFQKLKAKIADIVLWLLAVLVIFLIIYKHYKQWQEKRKKQ